MKRKKAIVISGISGGIGQAMHSKLAESGYVLVGLDVVEPKKNPNFFFKIDLMHIGDLEQQSLLSSFFQEINQQHEIIALVNNAATQSLGDFHILSGQDLDCSFVVNVKAPFLLTKILFENLKASNGRVINIGSIHGQQTKPGFLAYSISKSALRGLTRGLAIELGSEISVTSLELGAVDTPMLKHGFQGNPLGFHELNRFHPSGRIGTPDEVAIVVKFLVEEAPDFLNGCLMSMDGGISSVLNDPSVS